MKILSISHPAGRTRLSSDGSLQIDDRILEFAGISAPEVIVTGQIDIIEVWGKRKWEEATDPRLLSGEPERSNEK